MSDVTIKETDTLKVHYAVMPITTTNIDILVQVMEPVEQIPMIESFPYHEFHHEETLPLKLVLLDRWRREVEFQGQNLPESMHWMKHVTKVKLVECDILVPKKERE